MPEIKLPKVEELDLQVDNIENDFVFYYDHNEWWYFEAHFDNGKFNGEIAYCQGEDENGHVMDWNHLDFNDKLYKYIRKKL